MRGFCVLWGFSLLSLHFLSMRFLNLFYFCTQRKVFCAYKLAFMGSWGRLGGFGIYGWKNAIIPRPYNSHPFLITVRKKKTDWHFELSHNYETFLKFSTQSFCYFLSLLKTQNELFKEGFVSPQIDTQSWLIFIDTVMGFKFYPNTS